MACIYLVAMKDPQSSDPNYCDTNWAVDTPGFGGGYCTEIDILEANSHGWQSAVHSQPGKGGRDTDHKCDQDGCYSKIGVDAINEQRRRAFGPGVSHTIDTNFPFEVSTTVSASEGLKINMIQQVRVAQACARHARCTPEPIQEPMRVTFVS